VDISELGIFFKTLLLLATSVGLLHFGKYLQRRWLRWATKSVATFGALICTAFFGLLILGEVGCTKHTAIYSPTGEHVAVVTFLGQGALGDDYAVVRARPRWRPYAVIVYQGLGGWDFKKNVLDNPEIRWLDESHLLIRYFDDRTGNEGRGGRAICRDHLDEIEIRCESVR
jgi:hypothetical protein